MVGLLNQNKSLLSDYVINAGGLINVYNEMIDSDDANSLQQLNNIYDSLLTIFKRQKKMK